MRVYLHPGSAATTRHADEAKTLRLSNFLSLAAATIIVSGCESVGTKVGNTYERVASLWDKPAILPCPDYRILADASQIVKFRKGTGRDLVDVNIEGRIRDLTMECLTDLNKDTNSGNMEVAVTVSFGAKRGPANINKQAVLPYFISITDHKKNVLYREEFKVSIRFPGNQSAIQFLGETVQLDLPLTPKVSSQNYVIYLGFRLNREQLLYNQRIKERRRR